MHKYGLFYGDQYYPTGGWSDYEGSFISVEDAMECVIKAKPDWYQIVNLHTGEIVKVG